MSDSSQQSKTWRRSKIVLISLTLAAIAGALVVMYFAFQAFAESGVDQATHRYMAALTLVVVSLLAIALFCSGVLLIRYLSQSLIVKGGHEPTEYVDAWAVAGERLTLDEDDDEEDDDEGPTIESDPFEGDFDGDGIDDSGNDPLL